MGRGVLTMILQILDGCTQDLGIIPGAPQQGIAPIAEQSARPVGAMAVIHERPELSRGTEMCLADETTITLRLSHCLEVGQSQSISCKTILESDFWIGLKAGASLRIDLLCVGLIKGGLAFADCLPIGLAIGALVFAAMFSIGLIGLIPGAVIFANLFSIGFAISARFLAVHSPEFFLPFRLGLFIETKRTACDIVLCFKRSGRIVGGHGGLPRRSSCQGAPVG